MMSPSDPQQHDAHGKALALNLNGAIYGALAEIGAGQEVARWFLAVGGASGTVAKTMSAYDKTVSDEIYGCGTRYVSKERLLAMLDHEYGLLLERLDEERGERKCFFVFADTVAARNYQGTNQQHGWMGIRFQTEPRSAPSQILLHISLRDFTALLQQTAVGTLGVNLIYAAFHQRFAADTFLAGLFDELSIERIEIDVIELDGPAFAGQKPDEWRLAALSRHMTHAIVFDSAGDVSEPAGVLRKRPLVVIRGAWNNLELLDLNLLHSASRQLLAEGGRFEREPVAVAELTIRHVSGIEPPPVSELARLLRQVTGSCPVIVSDFPETYLLSRFLLRHSTEPVRFVMSVAAAAKIMNEAFYHNLPGSLLEGVGRLLADNVKLYVAPMPRSAYDAAIRGLAGGVALRESGNGWIGVDDLALSEPGVHLLAYLRASGRIVALDPAEAADVVR